ncbi:hypothetical protein [Lysinibacillus xylanilyticus]|uniref:hypothetical protein n=1 Tax=Lysinibacillus xylanilyticus TaxID=582475 RepID=UPI003D0363C5
MKLTDEQAKVLVETYRKYEDVAQDARTEGNWETYEYFNGKGNGILVALKLIGIDPNTIGVRANVVI